MEAAQRVRIGGKNAKRILLIVDDSSVGETLRVVPYFIRVRERYPHAHITLLANEDGLTGVTQAGVFDRAVISKLYDYRPYSRLRVRTAQAMEWLRLVRQLGTGYDLVITFNWAGVLLHLIGFVVCRGRRVGHAGYTRVLSRWLLTNSLGPFAWQESHPPQHAALLRAAGILADTIGGPSVCYAEEDMVAMRRLLVAHGLAGSPHLIVLHPGSDWACQQWLRERWAQLADELVERYHADVVFTGTAKEAYYVDDIRHLMKRNSASLAGRTTFPQLAALLSKVRLCVCVDSAIFELTQATGTPAVVLAGPSRPETSMYGARQPIVIRRMSDQLAGKITTCQGRHTALNEVGCWNYRCSMAGLRDITVADVLNALDCLTQGDGLVARGQTR